MQSRYKFISALVMVGFLTVAVRAQQGINPIDVQPIDVQPIEIQPAGIFAATRPDPPAGPVNLIDAIPVPGLPLASTDITWVDQATGRLFVTDRTNRSVDIFDAINDVYVDRVSGYVGTGGTNGDGPNGVLVTPDNILWVGDGNSMLVAADLNLSPPRIIQSISVGGPADGRADELGYDPFERVILVASDAAKPPHATFVSVDSYKVLGQVQFPDATGLEQPVWDTQLHRFLLTVPATPSSYIAVIDPRRMRVTKKYVIPNCSAIANGLVIAPSQRILASACRRPYIMSAIDGHVINTITQVGGGDEVWYNNGDGRYYVADNANGLLGVIDAGTSTWIQNVPAPGIRNPSAFEGNNHIFAVVRSPAAGVRDTSVCVQFAIVDRGCIAVFSHN